MAYYLTINEKIVRLKTTELARAQWIYHRRCDASEDTTVALWDKFPLTKGAEPRIKRPSRRLVRREAGAKAARV